MWYKDSFSISGERGDIPLFENYLDRMLERQKLHGAQRFLGDLNAARKFQTLTYIIPGYDSRDSIVFVRISDATNTFLTVDIGSTSQKATEDLTTRLTGEIKGKIRRDAA